MLVPRQAARAVGRPPEAQSALTKRFEDLKKKTKLEKGFLALLVTPDIIFLLLVIVSGIIYFFF